MERQDVEMWVMDSVKEGIGKAYPELVTLEAFLVEDLGADSFGTIMLLSAVDEKYGIEIPVDDLVKIKTVNDVVQYIVDHLKN